MQLPDSDIKTREVLTWEGLHLLHYDLSSCSQKVRILMGELGINYVSHPINLMRDEQRSDWYRGINPRAVVPVLVHDGAVHIESNDIIEYLDRSFAEEGASFLPVGEAEQAQMHELMRLEDQRHPDLRTVTFTYLAPDPSDHAPTVSGEDFGYLGRFHDAFSQLNERLASQPFLLGQRMTLADISWFITLHRLNLAGYPFSEHRHLHDYLRRISERPAFRKEVAAGPLMLRLGGSVYRHLNRLRKSLPRDYERWRSNRAAA
ncbi:MAG: glutathione S-transferase family protein [Pseudomonadota bacterium]